MLICAYIATWLQENLLFTELFMIEIFLNTCKINAIFISNG